MNGRDSKRSASNQPSVTKLGQLTLVAVFAGVFLAASRRERQGSVNQADREEKCSAKFCAHQQISQRPTSSLLGLR